MLHKLPAVPSFYSCFILNPVLPEPVTAEDPQRGCCSAGLLRAGEPSLTFLCDLLLCSHPFSAFHFKSMIILGFKWDFRSESPLKYPVVCKHTRAFLKGGISVFSSGTDTLTRCWPICMSECPGMLLQDAQAGIWLLTNTNAGFDTRVLRDLGRYLWFRKKKGLFDCT